MTIQSILQPTPESKNQENLSLDQVLKAVENIVKENRAKHEDANKSIKDFRRIFDQDSSKMNQTIFNDGPPEEIHLETLHTISSLIEILARTGK